MHFFRACHPHIFSKSKKKYALGARRGQFTNNFIKTKHGASITLVERVTLQLGNTGEDRWHIFCMSYRLVSHHEFCRVFQLFSTKKGTFICGQERGNLARHSRFPPLFSPTKKKVEKFVLKRGGTR